MLDYGMRLGTWLVESTSKGPLDLRFRKKYLGDTEARLLAL